MLCVKIFVHMLMPVEFTPREEALNDHQGKIMGERTDVSHEHVCDEAWWPGTWACVGPSTWTPTPQGRFPPLPTVQTAAARDSC